MENHSFSEKIIKKSFYLTVLTIERLFDTSDLKTKVEELARLDDGTLGKEIAKCLMENNLSLVPLYESHDLKHALLNYKMTPLDEIRLQAFMIGNGNWALPTLTIFVFGAILLPRKWHLFREDMRNGRKAISVKDWSIDEFADQQIDVLHLCVFNKREEKMSDKIGLPLRQISQFDSFLNIADGIFGMVLFCRFWGHPIWEI